MEETEKGSGQKGHTSLSPSTKSCRANQIEDRCHMANEMLIIPLCMLHRLFNGMCAHALMCIITYIHMWKFEYLIKIPPGQGSATLLARPFLIGGSGYETRSIYTAILCSGIQHLMAMNIPIIDTLNT